MSGLADFQLSLEKLTVAVTAFTAEDLRNKDLILRNGAK